MVSWACCRVCVFILTVHLNEPLFASSRSVSKSPSLHSDSPVVITKYGGLRGLRKTDESGTWEEYLGVPFASPPKRWQKPVLPRAWNGVRNATEYGARCVQIDHPPTDNGASENCLFANIFVPHGVHALGSRRLPVMVFIHGGAYHSGSGRFPGSDLALHGDVILVFLNYRLGVLGFLSSGEKHLPGNYALWDINMGLHWIQETIASFGGNKNRVTLFGNSAGAALVSHTLLSPHSKGLVHAVIEQSGSALSYFGYTKKPRQAFDSIAAWFFCDWYEDIKDIVDCLREEDPYDLMVWGLVSRILDLQVPNHIPVIDGDFMPKEPKEMYKTGITKNIDLISGSMFHDSAGFVFVNQKGEPQDENINVAGSKELLDIIIYIAASAAYNNPEAASKAIKSQYPYLEHDNTTTRTKEAVKAATDWWFEAAAHLEASLHSRASLSKNTYLYNYKYRHSFHHYVPWVNGSHANDHYSIWGPQYGAAFRKDVLKQENFSADDLRVSETVMSYWTNFAKTGNPNIGKPVSVKWPVYSQADKKYLMISAYMSDKSITEETPDQHRRFKFWNDYLWEFDSNQFKSCRQTKPGIKFKERPNQPTAGYDMEMKLPEEVYFATGDVESVPEKVDQIIKKYLGRWPKELIPLKEYLPTAVRRLKSRHEVAKRQLVRQIFKPHPRFRYHKNDS